MDDHTWLGIDHESWQIFTCFGLPVLMMLGCWLCEQWRVRNAPPDDRILHASQRELDRWKARRPTPAPSSGASNPQAEASMIIGMLLGVMLWCVMVMGVAALFGIQICSSGTRCDYSMESN